MTLLIQLVRWSQNCPALGESSDDVKSKRQFSQEHCELEISHTGQTVRSTRMREQEHGVADSGDCLCQIYQSINSKKFMVFLFFLVAVDNSMGH